MSYRPNQKEGFILLLSVILVSVLAVGFAIISITQNWLYQRSFLDKQDKLESEWLAKSCIAVVKLTFQENPENDVRGNFESGNHECRIDDFAISPTILNFNVAGAVGNMQSKFKVKLDRNTFEILSIRKI